ncbi:MAG: undecaprenyl-phosphate alpha-N-acetylglucosaminyl 1-phosphate transferase [Vicingaceae bacterium]|nr:MAG: undecaprenyl-phosphate alpha-N-acetylglucosaminyl 1-phosphate transferase [Vicingaceae bacterium]
MVWGEAILSLLTAFLIALVSYPVYIKVAIYKRLFDVPDKERKIHEKHIPSMGGIIMFAATLISFFFWYPINDIHITRFLVPSIIILVFIGIKDDIIGTSAVYKLSAQIFVALLMTLAADVRITGFHGLFGIREIPEYLSVLFTVFTFIVIINSFNLIDGIDGLAGGIGFNTAFWMGVWFVLAGNNLMSVLAFALSGSLLAFLIFNMQPAKVFMGDTGSLFIGLLMAVLSIVLIEYDKDLLPHYMKTLSKPLLGMAMLSYPLFDTLRVFFIRIMKGRSPFLPDRNHIHHLWIDLGKSHKQATFILVFSNIFIVMVTVLATYFLESLPAFLLSFGTTFLVYLWPWFLKEKSKK